MDDQRRRFFGVFKSLAENRESTHFYVSENAIGVEANSSTMFYFRLNKVFISDNGAVRSFLGILGYDFADVKFLSFVTPDNVELPNLDQFIRATDETQRATYLKQIVNNVVASRDITQVQRVTDKATITFGDTGYVLYQSERIPESFNWTFLAMKSNQGFRDSGKHVQDVLDDPGFGAFSQDLLCVVAGAAGAVNPAYTAGVAVAKFAAHVAAKSLIEDGDKELGLVYMSLNRREHYLHGERKVDGVPDLTNNMTFDYSIFGFDEETQGGK